MDIEKACDIVEKDLRGNESAERAWRLVCGELANAENRRVEIVRLRSQVDAVEAELHAAKVINASLNQSRIDETRAAFEEAQMKRARFEAAKAVLAGFRAAIGDAFTADDAAKLAVRDADALLAELAKPQGGGDIRTVPMMPVDADADDRLGEL